MCLRETQRHITQAVHLATNLLSFEHGGGVNLSVSWQFFLGGGGNLRRNQLQQLREEGCSKTSAWSLERAKCERLWHGTHLSSEAHYRPVLAAAAVAADEAAAAVNLLQLLLQGGVEGGGRAVNNPRLRDR